MLNSFSRRQVLLVIFATTTLIILGAYAIEYMGYAPCELCLMQRYAYYAVIPLSLIFSLLGSKTQTTGFYLLGLIMFGSMIFGIYHSGVEWKWWQGPSTCTGGGFGGGLPDLSKKAIMCDQPAITIIGLSLASWNAIISAFVSGLAFTKAYGSSSASQ